MSNINEVEERFTYSRGKPYRAEDVVDVAELAEWLDNYDDDPADGTLLDCLFEYLASIHDTAPLLRRFAEAVDRAATAELERIVQGQ